MTKHFKTQREEDAAAGLPLDKRMTEDPNKRGIPLFLQAQNRRPLTKAQQAKWEAMREKWNGAKGDDPHAGRIDFRKPASMTWEEWDAIQEAAAAERRVATEERIAKLKEKQPPKPKREPKPKVADILAGAVLRLVTKKNPYREGSAGHAVFAVYKDGMTTAAFAKAAAGKTGKRKPADFLMYDVRKGHVRLEKKDGGK